jgi:hypothetical protein
MPITDSYINAEALESLLIVHTDFLLEDFMIA